MEPDLDLLAYLTGKGSRYLEKAVEGTSYLPKTVVGVATYLCDIDGNVDLLTAKQQVTYEKFVKPLLFDVPCDGLDGKCEGTGTVETEALIACYNSGEFLCRACRAALAAG